MERRLHLFWPLTLIAAGVLWIMIELGRIPASNLWALTYLWPVLLIGAGLGLVFRPYWRYAGVLMSGIVVAALFFGVVFADRIGWNAVGSYTFGDSGVFGGPTVRGSGHVITDTRSVKDFSSVVVDFPGTVLIRQGTTESLVIEAEDNVAANMASEVTAGVLTINSVRNHRINLSPNKPVKMTITVQKLESVRFDAAGDVTIDGLKGGNLLVTLKGAGNITLNKAQLQSLTTVLDGAGSLHANGSTDALTVRLDGLGSFDGAQLQAQTVNVELDGLGSADVWAVKRLDASIQGMGSVNYYGSPVVTKNVAGMGNIHAMGAK